jgi:Transglycosylase SLT domain
VHRFWRFGAPPAWILHLGVVIEPIRRSSLVRVAFPLVATLIVLSVPLARVWATPHLKASVGDPGAARKQVTRLFDEIDDLSRVIGKVHAEIRWSAERISQLSSKIDAQQALLNRRAAEAYMGGRAGGIESVLDAGSFADAADALVFLDALSERDHDLLVALEHRKVEFERQRTRLRSLEKELRSKRDRLEAAAADLVERLRREHDAETSEDSGEALEAPPSPSSSSTGSATGRAFVTTVIRERFASLGPRVVDVALCVAESESGFDPLAVNPATEASGLFQFMPSTWEALSELAGWRGASVFDVRANASVAAWTVAHYGWHPWRSVAEACGA